MTLGVGVSLVKNKLDITLVTVDTALLDIGDDITVEVILGVEEESLVEVILGAGVSLVENKLDITLVTVDASLLDIGDDITVEVIL